MTQTHHGRAGGGRGEPGRTKAPYPVGGVMDALADALAEHDIATGDRGGDLTMAAAKIGVSREYAKTMLTRMRRRLGEWAR